MINNIKILSMDPGVSNFGYSLIEWVKTKKCEKTKLLNYGQLDYTIKSLKIKDIKEDTKCFRKDVISLIKESNLEETDIIFIERYMTRSNSKVGINSEITNIMIGIILEISYKLKLNVVLEPSVTWKSYYKRVYGTNNITKLFPSKNRKKPISPHTREAIAMGCYYIEKNLKTNDLLEEIYFSFSRL